MKILFLINSEIMVLFSLHLTSNCQSFEYEWSGDFLEKEYKIGLVKLEGDLKFNNKTKNMYISCNIINDSYINEEWSNHIYRFFNSDYNENDEIAVNIEPENIIYHKVITRPCRLEIKLVDEKNNKIKFDNIDLYIDLNLVQI
jgi:hypothetical protein